MKARQSLEDIFAQQPQNNRPSLEDIFAQPVVQEPSFVGGVKNAYNERLRNMEGMDAFSQGGLQTQGETFAQKAGQGAALIGDVTGEAVKSLGRGISDLTPDAIENPIKSGADFALKSALNTPQGKMVSALMQIGKQGYNKLEEASPRSARNLDALANIGMALPIGYGAGVAGKGAVKKVANTLDSGVLPDEYKTLSPLLKSAKPTVLSRTPKEGKLGLEANIGISKAYDTAKQAQEEAFTKAELSGMFGVDAKGVDKALNDIITSYKKKAGKGTDEQAAIEQLKDIQKAMLERKVVTAKDLMDIEVAINGGLPGNRFKKVGDKRLLGFKKTIKDALDSTFDANPEFANDYKMARKEAKNVARKFTKNKSLKPFWQPEDHTSWKANQNDIENPMTNDEGASRASTFIKHLNTDKHGTIRAVTNILPEEQVKRLMRAAVIKARQNDISFASAFNSLAHGNLGVAVAKVSKTLMGHGHGVPIDDAIKSLKGLRQKEVLKPNQALRDVEPILRDANPKPDISPKKLKTEDAKKQLGFTEEPTVYKQSRQGVASKMTKEDKDFAETARKKATETGLTPDVRRSQIVNQVNKAYEQRGLQRNAVKEAEIAKIAEKSEVPIETLVELADKNIKELANLVGSKQGDTAFAAALKLAIKNKGK